MFVHRELEARVISADDMVDETVLLRLQRRHVPVTVCVLLELQVADENRSAAHHCMFAAACSTTWDRTIFSRLEQALAVPAVKPTFSKGWPV